MRFACLVVVLLLTACATTTVSQKASLQGAVSCCKSAADFKYTPLSAAQKKFKLGEGSPVFDFDKGRSYFAAFDVPENGARHFRLKSYFNGVLIGQYLDPILLVLDRDFKTLTAGSLQLQFVDGNMFKDNNAHMVGEFRFEGNARYLVVLTSEFQDMAPVARTKPMGYGYMIGAVPIAGTTSGVSIPLERSPTGTLLIEEIP